MAPTKEYVLTMTEKCAMEAIGTAILCFAVATAAGQGAALTPIAVGATLMCIVYFGGHISGGQYNPAVALAIFLRGKMHVAEMGAYMASQIAGGFIGGILAMACVPDSIGAPNMHQYGGAGSALVGEIVMTFALCHVILHVATTSAQADNSYYGMAIGFTVLAGAVGVGPYSGGAFNPAVGIALPLLAGNGAPIWIYIVGPLIGGALSAVVFAFTHSNELPGTGPLRGIKEKFKDSATRKLASPIIMEFIGTMLLAVTIATSAAPGNPSGGLAAIAIGSTLMCQVYAAAATSGGQLNPAVTIGIAIRKILASWSVDTAGAQLKREFTNTKFIAYVLAQCGGALVGGLLGRIVVTTHVIVFNATSNTSSTVTSSQIGAPVPGSNLGGNTNVGNELVAELVATFLLVFTVLQAATSSKTSDNMFFGTAIGFVVVAMAVCVGGISGGALNPAIGLMAIVSHHTSFSNVWIYWVACPLGGVLAALAFRLTNAPEFLKAQDEAKTERDAGKNNTVFASGEEGPRQSNVFFTKGESKLMSTTTYESSVKGAPKEEEAAGKV